MYVIEKIFPRHFFLMAKVVGFECSAMEAILIVLAYAVDVVIERVIQQLPGYVPDALTVPFCRV